MNTVTMMTDGELLSQYARERSESAFEELVRRHINVVHSAALRQTPDTQQAEDIAQCVFADLARKAGSLVHHTSLAGWLFTSVRLAASAARRTQQRREHREREAMTTMMTPQDSQPDWAQIRPLLDETLCRLDGEDREAVLLRHFEGRSFAEIGNRLGLSENAARMRVGRALGKLHAELARRGVTSTEAALAIALAANAALAVPSDFVRRVVHTSLAAGSAGAGVSALVARLFFTKTAAVVILALAGTFIAAVAMRSGSSPMQVSSVLGQGQVQITNDAGQDKAVVKHAGGGIGVAGIAHHVNWTNGLTVRLTIVTADTHKPIPTVPLDVRGWQGGKFFEDHVVSDSSGNCDVVYPPDATELELTTRKDAFADTQLLWKPTRNEVIPTNYLLCLDRGTTIGGRVVDPDGNPIAGATVGWNHQDNPATLTLPQNHRFGWVTATTGADGRWTLTRIGADMILDIYGGATHSDYVGSALVWAHDKDIEQQLRAGEAVFKLGRTVTVHGVVLDEGGSPIAGAEMRVGLWSPGGSCEGKTGRNGAFSIAGCGPADRLITAEMPGFAATTLDTNLAGNVQLTLRAGKALSLHMVDTLGRSVADAWVCYDHMNNDLLVNPTDLAHPKARPVSPQAEFVGRTDRQGTIAWKDVPLARMKFSVQASGYFHASFTVDTNVEDQTFTLTPALIVHGTVSDAATGLPIPKFRMVEGWPEWNPFNNTTNPMWSTLGRFWSDYTGGVYSNSLDEAVVGGTENKGYFLKFVADGYAPFISRVIGPNEGNVELNATLQPAASVAVTVFGPDGQPARAVDVGLVSLGARLDLEPGGFSWQNIQAPGSLLKTDGSGQFKLAPDTAILRVIAASPDGYAESTLSNLFDNPVLHLQPWGALQINCQSNGNAVAGAEYRVDLIGGSLETVSFQLFKPQKTDAQGRTTFAMVPPGMQQLIPELLT